MIRTVLVLAIAALITISLTALALTAYRVHSVSRFPLSLKVGDHLAFNLDEDKIYFGMLTPGNTALRILNISHTYYKPLRVVFKTEGNISRWVATAPSFVLAPGTVEQVNLSVHVPRSAAEGSYEGELSVYFLR